jgi:ATP-binding cassette subfamily C protein
LIRAHLPSLINLARMINIRPQSMNENRPSPASKSARETPSIASAIFEFRHGLIHSGLLSFVINLLMLASPIFMLQVYDRVLTSRSPQTLAALTVLLAGIFVTMALLEMVRTRLLARAAAGFTSTLSRSTFAAILNLELANNPQSSNQPLRDLETLRQFAAGTAPATLFDMPWVPIYLALSFLVHPLIGFLTLAAGTTLVTLTVFNGQLTSRVSAAASDTSRAAHALVEDGRSGAEVLRALGMERGFADRWSCLFETALSKQINASDISSSIGGSSKYLRLFLQSGCLALGAALAISGEVSAGSIIAGAIIMSRALAPIDQATAQWPLFQHARQAYLRLNSVLKLGQAMSEHIWLPEPRGHLEVNGLSLIAPRGRSTILSDISFALKPGEILGVIGPSGGGKTTLARALVGVWPPTRGDIKLDGARLDHWPRHQLGAAIGYVPQDIELFSGTVGENISRLAADPDAEAIVRAAQSAGVHNLILDLPDGYMTELGETGARISAGQRQRIALARALYREPKLIVLDEPNSNLDAVGEAALNETLKRLRQEEVTVIMITHRPQLLSTVDKILVLVEGRAVAYGPREEILKPAVRREPEVSPTWRPGPAMSSPHVTYDLVKPRWTFRREARSQNLD